MARRFTHAVQLAQQTGLLDPQRITTFLAREGEAQKFIGRLERAAAQVLFARGETPVQMAATALFVGMPVFKSINPQ